VGPASAGICGSSGPDRPGSLGTTAPEGNTRPTAAETPSESVIDQKVTIVFRPPSDALDDAGSLRAAMIKASRAGVAGELRPMMENVIGFIGTKEFRQEMKQIGRRRR
jgi:hypothetical protein